LIASTASAERLVDTRQIARGDFLAPRFAPDGRELLVTGPQLRGLYLVGGPSVRALTDAAEAGIHARWNADGTISYRALHADVRHDLIVDRLGKVRSAPPATPVAFASNDRMYVRRGGQLQQIGSGDRFFGAVIAPDGDNIAFQGLVTGIYVYTRSSGTLVHVGAGTAPAWSPDSTRLAYEVTEDDGHDIVASDIYLYDVASDRVSPLTSTDRVIERRPSFSPAGTAIAFDDNEGGVFVGRLEVR
jgi:hypothetical protein